MKHEYQVTDTRVEGQMSDAGIYDASSPEEACRLAYEELAGTDTSPEIDDLQAELVTKVDDELCERWLGRDWPESTSPAEAMRLAEACQEKEDAGDTRDYTEILAEVLAEETAAMDARRDRVRRAIEVSAAFTRIEHMELEGADIDDLVADFSAMWAGETDSVENGSVTEVWGWSEKTAPGQHDWRVHIHH